ncbi:MAG TPA: maleylpyruvate isomerase family mycothiol-dependent enzyme [Acidimicrobiales bacterium]|nr:maleylpyruvate isomerase family mycothiol-dependent enzyme [Acidimicrobiales bacterium]
MDPVRHLATLRADAERMACAAEADLAAPVPSCPDWSMTDLVLHMGRIHRWVDDIIRSRHQERPPFPPRPGDDVDLPAWLREGADRLVEGLGNVDPDERVWNFTGADLRAGWWHRRQAQETAVHRWDAQRAVGQEQPIDADLAADGIDEFLEVILGGRRGVVDGRSMLLRDTERGREWRVRFHPDLEGGPIAVRSGDDESAVDATVSGTASDLLLFLWNREPATPLEVAGDAAVPDAWRRVVRV